MPYLAWEDHFSVGLAEMDHQHKKLIEIANALYDSMKAGNSKEILSQVFNELVEYTKYHFTAEEALMDKYQFPELANHRTQHAELARQVIDYQAKFQQGALFISIDVMNFLKDWLVNHILQMDQKYGQYIHARL